MCHSYVTAENLAVCCIADEGTWHQKIQFILYLNYPNSDVDSIKLYYSISHIAMNIS